MSLLDKDYIDHSIEIAEETIDFNRRIAKTLSEIYKFGDEYTKSHSESGIACVLHMDHKNPSCAYLGCHDVGVYSFEHCRHTSICYYDEPDFIKTLILSYRNYVFRIQPNSSLKNIILQVNETNSNK